MTPETARWLDACIGAFGGDVGPVQAFVECSGAVARKITGVVRSVV